MKDNSKSLLEKVWVIVKKNILVSATLVFVVVLILVSLGLVAATRIRENKARQRAYDALSDEEKALLAQDFTLAKDAYDFVNEAMTKYLNALAENDQEYLKSCLSDVNSNELDNIAVKSKYIDYYDNIVCYTQQGYADESFYVYTTYDLHIVGIETSVPAVIGIYYAKDAEGEYKIYKKNYMSNEVLENFYIAYMQQDVQDIYNQISLSYNETLESDEKLSDFILSYHEIVNEDMVALNEERERISAEEDTGTEPAGPVRQNVKALTSVNVRSSDSETAERLGTVSEGTVIVRVEEKLNGWSKVEYEGKEAYIKSQYLQVVDENGNVVETTPDTDNNNNGTDTTTTTTATGNNNDNETKYVTAIDNVNIRAEADIDSERVGFAYNGDKLEFVEKLSNGWTKIKYNGKDAYVKTDYVQ
ncbi:MAG: SH3 domain-containing protein [Lachnospiraceae bacterium]|nr:SH3 domain-containing protein [Lachnospiraceae bacterium]